MNLKSVHREEALPVPYCLQRSREKQRLEKSLAESLPDIQLTWSDIFPQYLNVVVPVRSVVLMRKSNYVAQLMRGHAGELTACADR